MFEFFYKRPHMLYSIIAAFFVMGLIGLIVMPKNLFPDAERPQVVVISQVPGATPDVVASTVSKLIEQEISTLGLIRDISSVNIAGISVVKAEFEYEKGLNSAAVDVNNALNKIKSKLPPNVNPSIYIAGAFTLPVDIFALSPANKSVSLGDIRKIVESDIKPALLRDPAVGNVEVFGGYEGAFLIEIDPLKIRSYNISPDNVINSLGQFNKNLPIGFVKGDNRFYTLTFYGERDRVENLKNLYVAPNVRLADVSTVNWSYQKRFSGYLGNGKEAIAVAIQRTPGGSVLATSTAARKNIKTLEHRYPNIHFEISDTQRDLLQTANRNMLEALRDAIIFTLIVLLFFLGNLKAITAALISIPMVFFSTLAIIWLSGGELNIVVYTAIILALGLLVDDAVVVLENIERHMSELKEELETAIEKGTKEVIAPVFAGTVATISIIAPLMFVGDFPQRIFRNLISALIIALLASYFLSITFIPHFSKFLYRKGVKKNRFENLCERLYQKSLGRLVNPYVSVLKFSNGRHSVIRKILMTGAVFLFLILSLKTIMPVIGKDVMPPMDTGIIKANIKFSANETVDEAINRIQSFTKWLHTRPEVKKSSISFGSEPGVLSLGNGALPTEAVMSIICVDRFSRKKTLWQIEDEIRDQLGRLKNVKSVDVYDFGATPMSSIKAPVDVRIFGEDYRQLPVVAQKINTELAKVKGLTSTGISWDNDFSEIVLNIDQNKAQYYGITPVQIAGQLALKGFPVSLNANLSTFTVQPVRLYYKGPYSENAETLRLVPIKTPKGFVPLSQLAQMNYSLTPSKIERDMMLYSIDVNGYRAKRPVTILTADAIDSGKHLDTSGFTVSQEGDIKQLHDSFSRMIKAIGIGVIILTFALISIYRSVVLSLVMIVVLPLSMIGASWGMLIFNKPSCMPSMVGILLLFGIIIKNSVLLVDFYQEHRKTAAPFDAAVESVRIRYRPVMMTAFGTIAGMIPIALERAVGLERLSPLADVAVGGLLIGTILTLIFVPMFAYSFDRKR